MLEQIVGVNDSGDRGIFIPLWLERETITAALAKISAEKRPNPSAPAFRDRHDDHIAARKLARTAAEISAHQPCNYSWKSRSRSCFCKKRPYVIVSITCTKIEVFILRESRLPSEWPPGAIRLASGRRIFLSRARNRLALSSG